MDLEEMGFKINDDDDDEYDDNDSDDDDDDDDEAWNLIRFLEQGIVSISLVIDIQVQKSS